LFTSDLSSIMKLCKQRLLAFLSRSKKAKS
jgi:hypothetical protein